MRLITNWRSKPGSLSPREARAGREPPACRDGCGAGGEKGVPNSLLSPTLSGSALTLGAGILFGVLRGSIIVSIAATLGATAAFLIARYVAREWVARKIAAHPKFAAVDQAVASEGWKMVGLIRLSPIFPFSLMNYAFGLTRVSLRDYFFASWIGMLPGTVMYVPLKRKPSRKSLMPETARG